MDYSTERAMRKFSHDKWNFAKNSTHPKKIFFLFTMFCFVNWILLRVCARQTTRPWQFTRWQVQIMIEREKNGKFDKINGLTLPFIQKHKLSGVFITVTVYCGTSREFCRWIHNRSTSTSPPLSSNITYLCRSCFVVYLRERLFLKTSFFLVVLSKNISRNFCRIFLVNSVLATKRL